jgi:serine O-acetyltransferase
VLEEMIEDLRAVRRNDPAAASTLEALLFHTPLHAIYLYRVAHYLHRDLGVPLVPRMLSTFARFLTGTEIHPGAKIGRRFFIDHGTGVVIGETAEIGDDCVFFHNVTLGGTGKHQGKRHPSLDDGVYVGTGAILLGPIRVGARAKIGANSFIHMRDVPEDCTVVGVPARIVRQGGERVELELPATELPDESVLVERDERHSR